ncbi:MAG: hypothetical protein LBL09_03285 [Oscillospiraceae bacterium]|nr:hypothetical protein [Oscillospiraceae bacterium]
MIAAVGLLPAVAVSNGGIGAGFAVYLAASILSLLILPSKSSAILYTAFFGVYPMVKSLIERINKMPLEWVLKLLFFNAVMVGLKLLFSGLFYDVTGSEAAFYLILAMGNIAFVVYDICFTGLIAQFLQRFWKLISK